MRIGIDLRAASSILPEVDATMIERSCLPNDDAIFEFWIGHDFFSQFFELRRQTLAVTTPVMPYLFRQCVMPSATNHGA